MRRPLVLLAAVALLLGSGVAVAAGAAAPVSIPCTQDGRTVTCTINPVTTTRTTTRTVTSTKTVTAPASTVTATESAGTTASPTSTASASPTDTSTSTTPTTTTTTTTTTPTPTPLLNLPRVPWEGGSAYWSQFTQATASGFSSASVFPIAVYFGKPEHAAQLKAAGVNTYLGAEHDGSTIGSITGQGLYVIAQSEWTRAEVGNDPKVVGWLSVDECDMGGCGGGNAAGDLANQIAWVKNIKTYNDGRFTFANYGNGVLGTFWAGGTMDDLVAAVDGASVDKYAYTSPAVQFEVARAPRWPLGNNAATVAKAAAYGWLADQMNFYDVCGNSDCYRPTAGAHPGWVFVESARPFLTESGSKTITQEQYSGAAWSAIIHGAPGLAIFQHNNGPECGTYSLVSCTDMTRISKIGAVNNDIQTYAPVLNTQSYVWDTQSGMDTMLKVYQGSAYLFADVGLPSGAGAKTFTLPPGVAGTTVEVVGEGRTLPVNAGKFTDTFASEWSHHVYRIGI